MVDMRNAYNILVGGPEGNSEDLDVDGKIILDCRGRLNV
jgi:hypothetical protein